MTFTQFTGLKNKRIGKGNKLCSRQLEHSIKGKKNMNYITAPLRALTSIFKTLTLFFLVIKLLENFSMSGIRLKDLDKEQELKNG